MPRVADDGSSLGRMIPPGGHAREVALLAQSGFAPAKRLLAARELDNRPLSGQAKGKSDSSRDRIRRRPKGFRVLVDVALGDGALLVAVAQEGSDEGGIAAVVDMGAEAGEGVAEGVEVAAALEGEVGGAPDEATGVVDGSVGLAGVARPGADAVVGVG